MTETQYQEQQIQEDRAALERARAERRRIVRVLKESRRVDQEALPKLRKAGRIR